MGQRPGHLINIIIMAPSVAEIGNSPEWDLFGLNSSAGRLLAIRLSDHYNLRRLMRLPREGVVLAGGV